MYAGAAYAAAPYAGGATTTTAAPDLSGAPLLLIGGGIYIEADFTAPLPEANAHKYVVALVYPEWVRPGVVLGDPIYPAATLYPAADLYPQGA